MKLRQLDHDVLLKQPTVEAQKEHELLGLPPLEEEVVHPSERMWQRELLLLLGIPLCVVIVLVLAHMALPAVWQGHVEVISDGLQSKLFMSALLVGFGAQMVDGALGMAYGITANTFLLSSGVPPAAATASVHLAEVFTTGFSGLSHWRFGNVDKSLFRRLVIPGVIGVVLGAYIITRVDGNAVKPYVSAYLLMMGMYILYKAFRRVRPKHKEMPKHVGFLAVFGGFVDSVGGGGWGPVVTTSLVGTGRDPRTTIGSVNAAEFFLALAGALSFTVFGAFTHWQVIAGLVVGGLFAAPFAAWLCRYLSAKKLMAVVGVLIVVLSARNLYVAL